MSLRKTAVFLTAVASSVFAADVAPSASAPASNPPQFIVLGSDDNTDPEALRWMVDVLKKYTHKDGSTLRMSFYSNTKANSWTGSDAAIALAHKYAYENGHEVSNHTETHIACVEGSSRASKETILAEMQTASDRLSQMAGIPKEHQFGFRTPYLKYSDSTFSAVKEFGFLYDCSISEGNQQAAEGSGAGTFFWPYTLATPNTANQDPSLFDANGEMFAPSWDTSIEYFRDLSYAPGAHVRWSYHNKTNDAAVRQHSGLWELPCYNLNVPSGDYVPASMTWESATMEMGGLDYNMWANAPAGYELSAQQSLDVLKHTLDKMYDGNRTPMTLGVHSQYYFQSNERETVDGEQRYTFPNLTDSEGRQWMFEEFVKYAVSKDNVWFVSGDVAIRYMKNPVSASQFDINSYAVIASEGGDTTGTGGDTTGTGTGTEGDAVEMINNAMYYGAYHDTADAGANSSVVLDESTDSISKVSFSLAVGGSWASAEAAYDSTFEKVTHIEVTYSATEDYKMTLPMEATGGNGTAHFKALPKGAGTVKAAIGDFSQPSWVGDTLAVEMNAATVSAIGFELADGVASGDLEITSVVLYGYPLATGGDTTGNGGDTTVTGDDLNLLSSNVAWYAYHDTANGAASVVDSTDGKFTGLTFDLGDEGTFAAGAPWVSEDFKIEDYKRLTITYTADVKFVLSLAMPGVTSDNGKAHIIELPASSEPTTINVGLLDFAQPFWVEADSADALDLSVVEELAVALADGNAAGSIEITEMVLHATGDATPVVTVAKPSVTAPVFNGIQNNNLSISVPTAGRYGIALYSLKGQKIAELSSNLTSGANSVDLSALSLSRQMVIVQISGKGMNSVHKAMMK